MTILVVAAHPDDELLGCGGTLAKRSDTCETHIAILGEGITSRDAHRGEAAAKALGLLRDNAREVSKLLGAMSVDLGDLPDNRFDQVPLLEIVKRVEGLVDAIRPSIIYTHHPGDLNIDHALTFRAVLTATRPVDGCSVEEIYTFEIASSTEWAFQQFAPFKPNVFVDINDTLDKKISGMTLYRSEVRAFPHPRSTEAMRAQARHWGAAVGLEYAEAFELVRSIRR